MRSGYNHSNYCKQYECKQIFQTEKLFTEDNNDRFWKVRILYDSLLFRCQQLSLETILCVDEQMVPFKGNIDVRQYIKGKPNPWGIKIFALAGQSGIIYDFLLYQGQRTELKNDFKKYGLLLCNLLIGG